MSRRVVTGAFGLCRDGSSGEVQVAPVEPVVPSWWHRWIHHTILQRRCQVVEKKFFSTGYTSDPPEQHTGVFSSQLQQFLQDRLHRCYGTGLTGTTTSAVRKANGYLRAVSYWLHQGPLTGLTGALRRKAPTALSTWWVIYMPSPGHLKFAGVQEQHTHTQERLQAIQELSDHIFSP